MHCPKCGVEVAQQSAYCHKCGERVDRPDQHIPPNDQTEAGSASQHTPAAEGPDHPADRPAPTPAARFRDIAAARQGREDEPEEELWQGRYSSKAMIGLWVLSGLITVAVLAVWIKWGLWSYWTLMLVLIVLPWVCNFVVLKYRQWNARYRLTSQRFVHETGILRRVSDRIEVIDMDDITFEQKLLERFVGVGTIHVSSSDRTHPELELRGIENVEEVALKIDDTRRIERRRRGLHIEAI